MWKNFPHFLFTLNSCYDIIFSYIMITYEKGINMNQILYVEKSKKKGGPLEKETVVKIFAIILIIFAVILIIKGIYSIYKSDDNDKKGNIPIVAISQNNNILEMNVKHDKAIDKIIYSWNDEEENILQGKGQSEISETITIPVGTNILHLKVVDIKGKVSTTDRQFILSDEDLTEPEIEFVIENSKVKIVAKDETQLSYIMYHWNEEDNTVVEAREDSPKQIEEKITILKGENTLTIIAVDKAGNETTKVQVFKGATKPTINIEQENNELIIKINDEENIQKIEIDLNGQFYSTDSENTNTPLDMKEVEIRQTLPSGTNTITITAYNVNGLSEKITKEVVI